MINFRRLEFLFEFLGFIEFFVGRWGEGCLLGYCGKKKVDW